MTFDARRLAILTVLVRHTEYLGLIMAQEWAFLPKDIDSEAPVLQSTSQELCENGAEHDEHETEKHHDIKHDRQ
jgi:hypothetical protein